MSGAVLEAVSPELALVDPILAEAQRQITERKAAMSATEPANGTFFVDPAQPAPQTAPLTPPAPAPLTPPAPAPLSTPPVEPAPQAAAPAPAPQPGPGPQPMVDVPLGTLIFRAGLLAEEQLEDALQEGMRTGKRLGEVLLERGLLHERDLGRMLAGQKGLPFVEIRASDADPAALKMLPIEKAKMQMALPLRYEDGSLVVAVADPSNELVLENLRRTLGAEPVLVVAAHGDLMRAIDEAYAAAASAPAAPEPQLQQPEPVPTVQPEAVQPLTPPAVTPLPTVLPPPEERPVEAAAPPPLQPEPVAQPVQAPPPAPEAPPAAPAPVEPEPAPLLTPPVAEPEAPAAAEQPAPPQPPVAPLQPQVEPAPQVEPVSAPVAETPPAPAPPVEQPAVPVQPEPPPAPAPMPAAAPAPEPASLHAVLVRLRDGETLEVGTFGTQAEAAAHAQEVVRMIASAEGEAAWPFFADRYLRPETIVSVDLVAEHAGRWMGSAVRSRWANHG